jgi:dihydropteroate synthase
MHMQGEPRSMQINPEYHDVVSEVSAFLAAERAACVSAGIAREAVALDPGLGFGKRHEHNMALLKNLGHLVALGSPLLVGVSRKSFIGRVLGRAPQERLYGGLGLAALAVSLGARVVRTHDVSATRDAIRMVSEVTEGRVH